MRLQHFKQRSGDPTRASPVTVETQIGCHFYQNGRRLRDLLGTSGILDSNQSISAPPVQPMNDAVRVRNRGGHFLALRYDRSKTIEKIEPQRAASPCWNSAEEAEPPLLKKQEAALRSEQSRFTNRVSRCSDKANVRQRFRKQPVFLAAPLNSPQVVANSGVSIAASFDKVLSRDPRVRS
jgi:hypothetical protein